jgi:hypothetical protein
MPRTKTGGKLKAKEVKDFLDASYDKTPPKDLDGYLLDTELSTDTAKVYYNPEKNHAITIHRGTEGITDWGNNLAYFLGYYDYTPRYKQGKSVQDKAETKYGKQNISTLGHSQGAVLARKLGSDTKEVINVNPLYTTERPKKNEYNIRSSTDIVSGLYAPVAKAREILYPNYSKKHDITIPSQSATDVLGEHSYNILDRMGDAEIGVGAGNKFSSNNIMRPRRLNYGSDDIDWIGGSVFINEGTNPYGVRGGKKPNIGKAFKKVGSDVSKAFKPVSKGLETAGHTLGQGAIYANPMMWALSDKGTSKKMGELGLITNDYLLPAVVSAGKPIYDATAMGASTMLTGNPMLGKMAADTLWNEMVAKKGIDPRDRQKSKELGAVSSILGQAATKPYTAAFGGNIVADEFRRRDKQRRIPMEGAGLMETLRSLYNYINPPESFEAWRARRQHNRITKAEADYLEEMSRIEQQGLSAKQKRDRAIKAAREYGVFEDVPMTDELRQVGERDRMGVEDKGSLLARQEGEIEEEDPEWAMNGRGRRKGKKKVG